MSRKTGGVVTQERKNTLQNTKSKFQLGYVVILLSYQMSICCQLREKHVHCCYNQISSSKSLKNSWNSKVFHIYGCKTDTCKISNTFRLWSIMLYRPC